MEILPLNARADKILTLAKLEKWIEDNIEELSLKFDTGELNNRLELEKSSRMMSGHHNYSKEQHQAQISRALMDHAVKLLNQKQQKIRNKKVEKFKFLCDPKLPYENKI